MRCPRCGNEDPRYFDVIKGRTYCRKCITFHRQFIDNDLNIRERPGHLYHVHYSLPFTLSDRQQFISDRLVENYKAHKNTLILAVCGSGKTEISFALIAYVLSIGQRVCFTVPRKALCVELYERFCEHFSDLTIGLIYGGCTLHPEADLILCTTHQLYRFCEVPFDLVLIDEADAFPFYGDEVLNAMFMRCVKGQYVKMSATLSSQDIGDEEVMIMNRRYHGHDLPVPVIRLILRPLWKVCLKYLIKKLRKNSNPILIYVPLKKDISEYTDFLSKTFRCRGVSSSSPDINEAISLLKNDSIDLIVTTTILERGITIDNVQVIVMGAAHRVFDERTLIQIAGRVGRKENHADGKIYFIDSCFSREMKSCIHTIEKLNHMSV